MSTSSAAGRPFGNVRALPSGRYQARFRRGDSFVKAPGTFATERDAWRWLRAQEVDIDRGTWTEPAPGPTLPGSDALTLGAYAETWLDTREVKPRTRAHYRVLLDRHILPTLGGRVLADITPAMVRTWHTRTARDTPTLRAHAYGLLRTICATAYADDLITSNPCRLRGAGSARRARQVHPATVAELTTLTAALPDRYRLLALLLAWCGMRYGEATELRRSDVVLTDHDTRCVLRITRGVVRVPGAGVMVDTPKTSAGRRDVTVPPHLVALVVDHLERHVMAGPDALLFPSATDPRRNLAPSTWAKAFYPARERAGRPDLRTHDLRHTGAVLAALSGATLADLMARLGHTTPQAAMIYQHSAAGRDAVVADRLSDLARA